MFTGLIQEKGKILRVGNGPGGVRLAVQAPIVSGDVKLGDSISVNGVCLTAVEIAPPTVAFDVVKETLDRSTLGKLRPGASVNLEPALRAGDRLGGHMVQGHVDGIGTATEVRKLGGETVFKFTAPPEVMQLIVEKGSITIDGISLTVADLGSDWFSVAIIPHTLAATTLGEISSGSAVNLETDIIGKYVYKFMRGATTQSDERLLNKLADGGWME